MHVLTMVLLSPTLLGLSRSFVYACTVVRISLARLYVVSQHAQQALSFCPQSNMFTIQHACRAALWHGSLQPSVLLALAISQAAPEPRELEGPPSDPPPPTTLQAQLFELRAHFDEQEAYFEQYTHRCSASHACMGYVISCFG